MNSNPKALQNLNKLFDNAPEIILGEDDKIVIFSDLHLGNGSSRDEFSGNSKLFKYILSSYYLKKGYYLFLNGDVEELYKFPIYDIVNAWGDLYSIIEEFDYNGKLFKIEGNHDYDAIREGFL